MPLKLDVVTAERVVVSEEGLDIVEHGETGYEG